MRSLGVPRLDVVNLRMGDRGHGDAPFEAALETLMSLLAWLLARSPNIVLIPGTTSLAHLEQNIAAGQLRLADDDFAQLAA
jgi:hypothetical protein